MTKIKYVEVIEICHSTFAVSVVMLFVEYHEILYRTVAYIIRNPQLKVGLVFDFYWTSMNPTHWFDSDVQINLKTDVEIIFLFTAEKIFLKPCLKVERSRRIEMAWLIDFVSVIEELITSLANQILLVLVGLKAVT